MRLIKSLFLLIFLPNIAFSAGVSIPSSGMQPFSVETKNGNLQVYSVMGTAHSGTYFKNPSVSTTSPSVSANVPMPFANKGGTSSDATLSWPVSPERTTAAAAQSLEAGLAALSATGNGYAAIGAVACAFVCQPAIDALVSWGADKFKKNPDGSISVVHPDTQSSAYTETSTGSVYSISSGFGKGSTASSAYDVALAAVAMYSSQNPSRRVNGINSISGTLTAGSITTVISTTHISTNVNSTSTLTSSVVPVTASSCPSGSPIVNGICNGSLPYKETPLSSYIQSNYTGKGWDYHWAGITAGLVAAGVNVFTDGTGSTITGPAIVPVSTSETKTSVSLLPGTTTPAPSGHTGPTESGTQTTTTTTTAHNTFRPGSSVSSGSPASGPSMETTQKTTTTTSITNNVTNITNIVNETTTEKDEAPEENATDTPLTGVPELYKQKYPDGLTGVFNDFKSRINTTSFVQLIGALTPNISGAGTCPSWTIDLTWTPGGSMGTHTIGQDFCWIWPILKIIVIVTTLFTVRRLIFGG